MGAILAVLTRDGGPPDPERLRHGLETLRPWGSGRAELWSEGGVALGCAPRDERPGSAAEQLPFNLPEAPAVRAAVDAALADRGRLCRALDAPEGSSDGELVLRAYLRWGERAPARLNGPFAFAIWDGRSGALVCARDHVGMRPLLLAQAPGALVVASGLEAALALSGLPRLPDREAELAHAARNHAVLLRRSFVAGIGKLAPGELLVARPRGTHRRVTYWRPGPVAPLRLPDRRDYGHALREAIATATADSVRTDRPVGAHVSGGLDSSLVAVLGQRALTRDGRALARIFSWAPPPGTVQVAGDERERVLAVADALGVPASFVELTAAHEQRFDELRALLLPTNTLLRESVVIDRAAAGGIGVLLSGWGGDEAASFNGRGQLAHLALRGRWVRLARDLVLPAHRNGVRGAGHLKAGAATLWERVALPLLPDPAYRRLAASRLERGPGSPAVRRLRAAARVGRRMRRSPRDMQTALILSGHLAARLEAWTEYAAPRGVDHRYPLLDRRVIELALSFPPDVWLADGYNRWVMRVAADGLLPAAICWGRPKSEPALVAPRTGPSTRTAG